MLQRSNIHIAVCPEGTVGETLAKLRVSPKTAAGKAKFILATDGVMLEAEDLNSGETIACEYPKFADRFAFFLQLAGISPVRSIKNNPIDIKATGRLNKLYVELLKDNPNWATHARRHEMNQFMARLIFCFFAEDTGIFLPQLFTKTIERMSSGQTGNTHEVMAELFRAMDIPPDDSRRAGLHSWANQFPYVNGGLFRGTSECPRFSRVARSLLLRVGELSWQEINPDIFGSMIQAVADNDERGELGLHYTSVPNILKVLNPLFLDDLREQLKAAGDSPRKLRNLRRRLSAIRVFDPACGSGNFLVIAYIKMREIEREIAHRTGDEQKSWIPLANFYGIEIKSFAAEMARLSLLIAEFQCDVRLISQQEAQLNVLPLHKTGQIHTGHALQVNWLEVCPPVRRMQQQSTDLFDSRPEQAEIDFDAKQVETFICGNPPYAGKGKKTELNLLDMKSILAPRAEKWGYVDYVGCWFVLASDYCRATGASAALVATNSVCQGRQLPQLWPLILSGGIEIGFAHLSFKWSNNAVYNAGVICVVIGIGPVGFKKYKKIFSSDLVRTVPNINAYLLSGETIYVESRPATITRELAQMLTGSVPNDGGNFLFSIDERDQLCLKNPKTEELLRPYLGSQDFIQGQIRFCLCLHDNEVERARCIPEIGRRLDAVRDLRLVSPKKETRELLATTPHRFQHRAKIATRHVTIVPRVSSENRPYLPVGLLEKDAIVSDQAFFLNDAPLWNLALVASRIHLVWIGTVCGKMKSDFRYSNSLGWNTFPVPSLTEKNKIDLTRCAEDILLAREAHFPATIADLYEPETMPTDLRAAHDHNDETLERIYIGRCFRNDTERLEKLFEMYTKMAASPPSPKGRGAGGEGLGVGKRSRTSPNL